MPETGFGPGKASTNSSLCVAGNPVKPIDEPSHLPDQRSGASGRRLLAAGDEVGYRHVDLMTDSGQDWDRAVGDRNGNALVVEHR